MYEKTETTKFFLKRSSLEPCTSCLKSTILTTTLHSNLCFFFAFNTFVLGFATGQLQPWSAEPRSAATALQPPAPQPWLAATSHATQRSHHGPSLPLDATVAPVAWLRPGRATAPAGCAKAVAIPGWPRQATASHPQN
jgi:hypothetical protein